MTKAQSKTKLLIYSSSDHTYLMDVMATMFSTKISEAKDFSWMGILIQVYLWALNKQFPEEKFVLKKAINLAWAIDVPLKQEQ